MTRLCEVPYILVGGGGKVGVGWHGTVVMMGGGKGGTRVVGSGW